MKIKPMIAIFGILITNMVSSQILLRPDKVFDGKELHENWVILIEGEQISKVGLETTFKIPKSTKEITLKGLTVMPGIIEGHSHLLLHPYNETSWNDQVLKESPVERSIRGVVHAKNSLLAGITTMRDLGSEGAGYSDVYLKESIEKDIVVGPRVLAAGPAIVATGAYGPKGFHDGVSVPLGAEEASGEQEIVKTVRRQLGNGVDFIKIYADYRWRTGEASQPTFSQKEIEIMVQTAESAGRYVVAHASTPEGMRRATMAGVETIEHGDGGTLEIFELMKQKGIAFCPTITAGEAVSAYNGWDKNRDPDPDRIIKKKASFKLALTSGVKIVFGGDVGVFTHGENYRELELMVAYGMQPLKVLQSATSVNAHIFHLDKLGQIREGFIADIIAVEGNPVKDISNMRKVRFVRKNGEIYKHN